LANRESPQGPGGWQKILKSPNPDRGGARSLLIVRTFSWAILLRKTASEIFRSRLRKIEVFWDSGPGGGSPVEMVKIGTTSGPR
jgi:hypothetical protein